MNKNKLIFAAIGIIILVVVIVLFIVLQSSTPKQQKDNIPPLRVWIYQDSGDKFSAFLEDFKTTHEAYANVTFDVKSFATYQQYFYALSAALLRGDGPDIFVVNSSDVSVFAHHSMKISPADIDPVAFDKDYVGFFGAELIAEVDGETPSDPKIKYVTGIPLGYETLSVFYNTQLNPSTFKNDTNLATLVDLNQFNDLVDILSNLHKNRQLRAVPVAMGDGTTTKFAPDIFAQFLMLEQTRNINDTNGKLVADSLARYQLYYQDYLNPSVQNESNNFITNLKRQRSASNVQGFAKDDAVILIAYPRVLEELIANNIKNPGLISATPFPKTSEHSLGLVNYDSFVINSTVSDTHYDAALDLLVYMRSGEGQRAYIKQFPYYFPAQNIQSEISAHSVHPKFKITYKDITPNTELRSFPKGLRVYYDAQTKTILDTFLDAYAFQEMIKENKCITQTMLGQETANACRN